MPRPSFAARARSLAEQVRAGVLSTISTSPAGWPFGSHAPFSLDAENRPILLISRLAEHTRNLEADPRASLLYADPGEGAGIARVTVLARFTPVAPEEAMAVRALHLARLPEAAAYAGLADFSFFRGEVTRVRFIGGFGQIGWVEAEAWSSARPDPLLPARAEILDHMNQDHAEAMTLMLRAFRGLAVEGPPFMTEVDAEGFELRCTVQGRERLERFDWDAVVDTPEKVRTALVALVRAARSKRD